jgi:hypothetical protein
VAICRVCFTCLRLVCTNSVDVESRVKYLAWPALPILIYPYSDSETSLIRGLSLSNLFSALEQPRLRACSLIWRNEEAIPGPWAHINLESAPMLPDSFLGGSAPRGYDGSLPRQYSIPGPRHSALPTPTETAFHFHFSISSHLPFPDTFHPIVILYNLRIPTLAL